MSIASHGIGLSLRLQDPLPASDQGRSSNIQPTTRAERKMNLKETLKDLPIEDLLDLHETCTMELANRRPRSNSRSDRASRVVTFNVGGIVFATLAGTLLKDPDSLLASTLIDRDDANGSDLAFFDRSPGLFGDLMDLMRTRDAQMVLAAQNDVARLILLLEEASFFALPRLADMIDSRLRGLQRSVQSEHQQGAVSELMLGSVQEEEFKEGAESVPTIASARSTSGKYVLNGNNSEDLPSRSLRVPSDATDKLTRISTLQKVKKREDVDEFPMPRTISGLRRTNSGRSADMKSSRTISELFDDSLTSSENTNGSESAKSERGLCVDLGSLPRTPEQADANVREPPLIRRPTKQDGDRDVTESIRDFVFNGFRNLANSFEETKDPC